MWWGISIVIIGLLLGAFYKTGQTFHSAYLPSVNIDSYEKNLHPFPQTGRPVFRPGAPCLSVLLTSHIIFHSFTFLVNYPTIQAQ